MLMKLTKGLKVEFLEKKQQYLGTGFDFLPFISGFPEFFEFH
jgi:hypothetical protein